MNELVDKKIGNPLQWCSVENVNIYDEPLIWDDICTVVFLDIDGVLNCEDYRDQIAVHDDKVARLARIVHSTNADIVLTSSWRGAIRSYLDNPDSCSKDIREHCEQLRAAFEKYELHISSATDVLTTGPDARPLEIRCWLAYRPQVERFVILDDDGFWTWNWLKPNVVRTIQFKQEVGDYPRERRGLEDCHVQEAIRILTTDK